jgi:hypothetical protein
MAKEMDRSTISQMETENLRKLEFYIGQQYQIKLTNLESLSKGNRSSRRCQGSDPAFSPIELYTQGSHENFDVFSLSMMMLDFELAYNEHGKFSEIHEIWMNCMRNQQLMNDQQMNQISNHSLFEFVTLFEHDDYRPLMDEAIRKYFPNVDKIIQDHFGGQALEDTPLEECLDIDVNLFRSIMISVVDVYFNRYYFDFFIPDIIQEEITHKVDDLDNAILQVLDDQEKLDRLNFKRTFYVNKIALLREAYDIRKELIQLYLSQINNASTRLSMEKFMEKIVEIRTQFDTEYGEQVKFNLAYMMNNSDEQSRILKSEENVNKGLSKNKVDKKGALLQI